MGNILNRLYKVGNLICKYSHLRPVLYSRFNLIKWNTFKTKIRVSLLLSMFSLMFEGFNSQKANVVAAIPFTSTGNQESNLTLTNLLEIAGLALSLCCQSQLRVWTIDCTTRGSDTLQLNVHIKRKNNVKSMDMNSKGREYVWNMLQLAALLYSFDIFISLSVVFIVMFPHFSCFCSGVFLLFLMC